jgi:hypothetical protein
MMILFWYWKRNRKKQKATAVLAKNPGDYQKPINSVVFKRLMALRQYRFVPVNVRSLLTSLVNEPTKLLDMIIRLLLINSYKLFFFCMPATINDKF